jgi:hypothetical protein
MLCVPNRSYTKDKFWLSGSQERGHIKDKGSECDLTSLLLFFKSNENELVMCLQEIG